MDIPASTSADNLLTATFAFPLSLVAVQNKDVVPIVEVIAADMEVYSLIALLNQIDTGANGSKHFITTLSIGGEDNPGGTPLPNQPNQRTFYRFKLESGASTFAASNNIQLTGAGSAGGNTSIDFTDRAGHGILLYGNTLTVSSLFHGTTSPGQTIRLSFCIKWRVKYVDMRDYVSNTAQIGGLLSGSVQTGT